MIVSEFLHQAQVFDSRLNVIVVGPDQKEYNCDSRLSDFLENFLNKFNPEEFVYATIPDAVYHIDYLESELDCRTGKECLKLYCGEKVR